MPIPPPRPSKCFICHSRLKGGGDEVAPEHRATVEHFIPRWLLRQAGLHVPRKGNHMILSNNVTVRGPVTVPCCKRCNERLSLLESRVRLIFEVPAPLSREDRQVMFLWLLKVAYGSAYVEARSRMTNRHHIDFGSVMSRTSFNRMRLFHGRVLREYCLNGTISHLQVEGYSLVRAAIEDTSLYFSKAIIRNRVTVAWRGSVFRLTIDGGEEERQVREGETVLQGRHFDAFMSSNDVFTTQRVQYPRLQNRRQKMANATTRPVRKGDRILITHVERPAEDEFLFVGHILQGGSIVAHENVIQIVVRRTQESERMRLDKIEVQQPGLRQVIHAPVATVQVFDSDEAESAELSDIQPYAQLLFYVHLSLGVTFDINPPVELGIASVP